MLTFRTERAKRKLPQKVEWRRRGRSEGEDRWAWWPIGWSQGREQQELQEAPNVDASDTAAEGRSEEVGIGPVGLVGAVLTLRPSIEPLIYLTNVDSHFRSDRLP